MPQSLSKIYIHIIFHIKSTSVEIKHDDLDQVFHFIGKIINDSGSKSIRVGGTGNHVHIVCFLSKNDSLAHLVEEIKRNSSRWIKHISVDYNSFAWQGGYAAFSISQSVVDKTIAYVDNQEEHHKKISFHDELIGFLKAYHVDYNEDYLFSY